MHETLFIMSLAAALAAGPSQGLKPWGANTRPTDVAKRHVE